MSDQRSDAPLATGAEWLARFLSKRGMGACICEGQEIHAAANEIDRLRAAVQHESDCVEAYRAQAETMIRERDELRRQLAEAELDAGRYRWLRNEANTARKCDPMVCIYPLDEQDLIDGDRLDIAIDAAMELTRPAGGS